MGLAADKEELSAGERSSKKRAWWTLGVLTFVAMVDFADRSLMGAVAEPIRLEFGLSDTELGILMGFAFSLLRVCIAIPMGRLADVWNRRNLLAIALSVWSIATFSMALAKGYVQLLAARLFIGAGTAGSFPPALSMISDLFPMARRGIAMGVWNVGTVVGSAIGLGGGAILVDAYGWRTALLAFGGFGLAVAVLLLIATREPERKTASGQAISSESTPSTMAVLRLIVAQKSLCHAFIAFSLLVLVDIAIYSWAAVFFIRSHGMSISEAGVIAALIFFVAGSPGTLFGGYLMDWLAKRDIRWHAWSSMLVALITIPPALLFLLNPSPTWGMVFMFVYILIWSMWYAPQTTLGTGLVGSQMRATTWAVFSICLLIIGGGLGPLIVGSLSDLYAPERGIDSLRYALATIIAFQAWGAVHLYLVSRTLAEDYKRVEEI